MVKRTINVKDLISIKGYIWYACYGSNINNDRFMKYINSCKDKNKPLEFRKYIINHPLYFAGDSKIWTGGMAFIDYLNAGKSYGKIYKIKVNQFIDIFNLENDSYDLILLLDYIEELPVLTFTSKRKQSDILNKPSDKYLEVIKKGLKELYNDLNEDDINDYLLK